MRCAIVLLVAFSLVFGCATYREELARGKEYYAGAKYEHALAVARALEPDFDALSSEERTEYCFLRGMTDYHLGFRADSRHWLALAAVLAEAHPGTIDGPAAAELTKTLDELNQLVWTAARSSSTTPVMSQSLGRTP